jgi:hypothetical protein
MLKTVILKGFDIILYLMPAETILATLFAKTEIFKKSAKNEKR